MLESPRSAIGLLDTSVVIDLRSLDTTALPTVHAISAVTLAELAAGPPAATSTTERAARQELLQVVEATFHPIAFDVDAARAYGRISATVAAAGRKPRGSRAVDLLIAATAMAHGLPLYTRNPDDFVGLDHLIEIVAV
ncbi:type II toxin-antitoxin system VapC family toxin [Candidatus Poriferisodalis sp.]|uniref:type II toxin-antitoxin system VapC family toxin n=1 Tax=Candidatus Poriferisodalis sp. TaxID=3101277 RepID=UPI003B51DA86